MLVGFYSHALLFTLGIRPHPGMSKVYTVSVDRVVTKEQIRKEMDLHLDEGIELLWSIDLHHGHVLLWKGDIEVLILVGFS